MAGQCCPVHIFHHNAERVIVLNQGIQLCDVWVIEAGLHFGFAAKTLNHCGTGCVFRTQLLDRDLPVKHSVHCPIHHTHAAHTQLGKNPVLSYMLLSHANVTSRVGFGGVRGPPELSNISTSTAEILSYPPRSFATSIMCAVVRSISGVAIISRSSLSSRRSCKPSEQSRNLSFEKTRNAVSHPEVRTSDLLPRARESTLRSRWLRASSRESSPCVTISYTTEWSSVRR